MRTLPRGWFDLRPSALIDTAVAIGATEAAAAPEEAAVGAGLAASADAGLVAGSVGAASVAPEVAGGLTAADIAAGGTAFAASPDIGLTGGAGLGTGAAGGGFGGFAAGETAGVVGAGEVGGGAATGLTAADVTGFSAAQAPIDVASPSLATAAPGATQATAIPAAAGTTPAVPIAGGGGTAVGGPIGGAVSTAAPASVPVDTGIPGGFSFDQTATAEGDIGTAGGGGAPGGGGSTSSLGKFLSDPSLSKAGDVLGNNAGLLLTGGLFGAEAAMRPSLPSAAGVTPTASAINTQAGNLAQQSQQLTSALETGNLPPGIQASLKTASESAKATVRSQYASRDMSGSSSEAQDLANIDEMIASQGSNIAVQLLNTGITEAQLSSQLYSELLNASLQQDQALSESIANFTSAIAASSRPIVTVGG